MEVYFFFNFDSLILSFSFNFMISASRVLSKTSLPNLKLQIFFFLYFLLKVYILKITDCSQKHYAQWKEMSPCSMIWFISIFTTTTTKTLETKSNSSKRWDFTAMEISHILTAVMVTQIYLSIYKLKMDILYYI